MREASQCAWFGGTGKGKVLACGVAAISLALLVIGASGSAFASEASASCANEAFRNGASANLPDCRAYELVTPPNVNGFPEDGTGAGASNIKFSSPPVVPSGDSYLWTLTFSGLSGTGSTGFSNLYQARRTAAGWSSSLFSPDASESEGSSPGSASRDQQYATFELEAGMGGSLAFCPCQMTYVRYPDGTFHLLGEGTVPADPDTDGYENGFIDDPHAAARWISPGGSHQIFESFVQLTAEAPSSTNQVYDRTPAGLQLLSLLPEDTPPTFDSTFAGSSVDGATVLFKNGGNLYARLNDSTTIELASGAGGEVLPGGVDESGSRAFFVQTGNIYYYDFGLEEVVPVVTPGNAILTSVSPDGSHAFFVSETELVPGEGTPGALNFYAWDGSSIQFIATVSYNDLSHPSFPPSGLNYWTPGLEARTAAVDANRLQNTTRTTADGKILVFESYEQLTSYANEGHIEIYRYDTTTGDLTCVSCGALPAATADSEFVHAPTEFGSPRVYPMNEVANLSDDGQRVVFESLDALVPEDVNGVRDVYEWTAGSLHLISTGQSAQPSLLFAVTPSADDTFFETGEKLVGEGQEPGRFAVYDARVGGGLASQQPTQPLTCVGRACQGEPAGQPDLSTPGSAITRSKGNVRPRCIHRSRHQHRKGKKAHSQKRKHHRACRHHPRRRASK